MKQFFELIKRLRTETPDWRTTSKYALYLGVAFLCLAVWNFVFVKFMMVGALAGKIDSFEIRIALALIALAGFLALAASPKLKRGAASGIQLAKLALFSSLSGVMVYLASFWTENGAAAFMPPGEIGVVFKLLMTLAFSQVLVPGWLAIGYLDRLREIPSGSSLGLELDAQTVSSPIGERFRECVFPFGVQVTFLVSMVVVMLPALLVAKLVGMDQLAFAFVPGILILLLAPALWNELPSSFERERQVLSKHRVGISLFFFSATDPLCKLLIYRDGVEVRVEFNRFFLPYDRLTGPLELEGLLSKSLVLRSRLTDVPDMIRIRSGKADRILDEIRKAKAGRL